MPKEGLSDDQWHKRLKAYAAGTFQFGRGQRPSKGTSRAQTVEKLEKCPRHRNRCVMDVFGRPITCVCGYHASSNTVRVYTIVWR